jgi:hypothetical protein
MCTGSEEIIHISAMWAKKGLLACISKIYHDQLLIMAQFCWTWPVQIKSPYFKLHWLLFNANFSSIYIFIKSEKDLPTELVSYRSQFIF